MNNGEFDSDSLLKNIQSLASDSNLELLEKVFELLPVVVVITNKEGNIEYANKKFESLTGYSIGEVLGKNPSILQSEGASKFKYQSLWTTLLSGKTWKGVFKNQTKLGRIFYERAHIAPLFGSQGEISHFIALKEDISETKRLSQALEESESRFKLLFDSMSNGYASFRFHRNKKGEVVSCLVNEVNSAFEKIISLNGNQFLGRDADQILPKVSQSWLILFQEALKMEGEKKIVEFSKSHEVWFEVYVNPIQKDYFSVLFVDTTRHRLAEETNNQLVVKLKNNIKHLDLLYKLSSLTSSNKKNIKEFIVQGMNLIRDVYKRQSGLNFHLTWNQIEIGEPSPEPQSKIFSSQLMLSGLPFVFEIWVTESSVKRKYTSEISVFELFYKEFFHSCELILLEKQLMDQQSQIFQASKLVSLGELTSGVAHEINNPCNYILLNTEILEDLKVEFEEAIVALKEGKDLERPIEEIQTDFSNFLKTIHEGAIRIKTIVENLKDYSRSNDNDNFMVIDLRAVVENAAAIVGNAIKKSCNNFSIICNTTDTCTKGHFHQLEQVVINVIMNATRALKSKEDSIVVEILNESTDTISIVVKDNGVGIKEEHLKKITDPFFTTYRSQGGTGLGLSISHQIISNHQGSLEFESKVNQGTKVRIQLPKSTCL